LIDVEQGEVILRSNNEYLSYKGLFSMAECCTAKVRNMHLEVNIKRENTSKSCNILEE